MTHVAPTPNVLTRRTYWQISCKANRNALNQELVLGQCDLATRKDVLQGWVQGVAELAGLL